MDKNERNGKKKSLVWTNGRIEGKKKKNYANFKFNLKILNFLQHQLFFALNYLIFLLLHNYLNFKIEKRNNNTGPTFLP